MNVREALDVTAAFCSSVRGRRGILRTTFKRLTAGIQVLKERS
jgi:hypothetical protein